MSTRASDPDSRSDITCMIIPRPPAHPGRRAGRRRRSGRRASAATRARRPPWTGSARPRRRSRPRPSRAAAPPDRRPPGRRRPPVPGVDRDPGPPGQDVVQVQRPLVRDGVPGLHLQVLRRASTAAAPVRVRPRSGPAARGWRCRTGRAGARSCGRSSPVRAARLARVFHNGL